MINMIETLPEKWCIDSAKYSASYEPNKIYLGRSNNLERHTYVTISIVFQTLDEQKEFFDWWKDKTDSGGRPFYANLPMFADVGTTPNDKFYMLAQSKPFTQSVDPYIITGTFMLFLNKTKDETAAPIARDVFIYVDEESSGNMIMLDATDPDEDVLGDYELVGYSNVDGSTAVIRGASILYAPPSGFTGDKTIDYRVSDGVHYSNTATVTIKVVEVNVPVAVDFTATVVQGSATNENRQLFLEAFDRDGRELTYTIVTQGSGGEVVAMNSNKYSVTYTIPKISPAVYSYTFAFKVNNGVKDSNTAICTVQTKLAVPIPQLNIKNYEFLEPCSGDADWYIFLPCKDINDITLDYSVTHISGAPASFYEFIYSYTNPMGVTENDRLPSIKIVSSAGSSGVGSLSLVADNSISTTTTVIDYNILDVANNEIYKTVSYINAELPYYASNVHINVPFVGINYPFSYNDRVIFCNDLGNTKMNEVQGVKMTITQQPPNGIAQVFNNSTLEYIKQGDFEHEMFKVEVENCAGDKVELIVDVTMGVKQW